MNDLLDNQKKLEKRIVNLRMPQSLYEQISRIAKSKKVTRTIVMLTLIEYGLQILDKESDIKR